MRIEYTQQYNYSIIEDIVIGLYKPMTIFHIINKIQLYIIIMSVTKYYRLNKFGQIYLAFNWEEVKNNVKSIRSSRLEFHNIG